MQHTSFLDAVSVTKNYNDKKASGVNNISISIAPGKITAIVGESGSGKSTLLKLLFGLLSPDSGKVSFRGEEIWGPEIKLIPGHDDMRMVTQHTDDLNLFATVYENIAQLLPNTDIDYKASETERYLKQLNIYKLKDKRVADLSGGEKQRVAIARSLITKPEVLLLDEPFNQVDASFREGLQQNIRTIVQETGLTVILVSHDPAEVLSMADVLVVIKDGEIVESGTPEDLFRKPEMLYTAQLLSNRTVLNKEEALLCDIKTEKETVAISPEHVILTSSLTRKDWTVKQVLFKGFFEDVIIEKDGLELRALNLNKKEYKTGDKIHIRIAQFLEY
ncbi:ABC transporter ATP-binding protein [Mucilaginibacter sp. HMF5004]|uniref:ABC transporter ATP-binding protein n=1 Tax=Mucilaginibacter rivuli TaxID=2857527 RepID=UPI001C5E07C0|nr:ABC transporter ATP-binding protein [Mucilaginibacter rivuli]MBW4890961.1 ABC transporter ATP-binding protein [Mucilaginibacter rivuli]